MSGVSDENRRLMNKMKVYGHRELHTVSSILIHTYYGVTLLCTQAHDCSQMCPTVVDLSGMSHGVSRLWPEGYGAMQLLPSRSPTVLCRALIFMPLLLPAHSFGFLQIQFIWIFSFIALQLTCVC